MSVFAGAGFGGVLQMNVVKLGHEQEHGTRGRKQVGLQVSQSLVFGQNEAKTRQKQCNGQALGVLLCSPQKRDAAQQHTQSNHAPLKPVIFQKCTPYQRHKGKCYRQKGTMYGAKQC